VLVQASAEATSRRISESEVCDKLAEFLAEKNIGAATPDEWQVRELTHWINTYRRRPWDKASIQEYRDADRQAQKGRKILDEADDIFQQLLREWQPVLDRTGAASAQESVSLLKSGIAAITFARKHFDQGLLPLADRGPDPKPWAIMARVLAGEALSAIRTAQRAHINEEAGKAAEAARRAAMSAGDEAAHKAAQQAFAKMQQRSQRRIQKTVGSADGPIIKFVEYALRLILPPGQVPARATILDAVKCKKHETTQLCEGVH